MIIKIHDRSNSSRQVLAIEAERYGKYIVPHNTSQQYFDELNSVGSHYVPFQMPDYTHAYQPGEFMVLKIIKPYDDTPIIVTGCIVFVMNNDGQTIDKWVVEDNREVAIPSDNKQQRDDPRPPMTVKS